jgi:hypothetical protein
MTAIERVLNNRQYQQHEAELSELNMRRYRLCADANGLNQSNAADPINQNEVEDIDRRSREVNQLISKIYSDAGAYYGCTAV